MFGKIKYALNNKILEKIKYKLENKMLGMTIA